MNSEHAADSGIFNRVHAFLGNIHAGDVTESQMVEFEQLLRNNEEAQTLYAELIELSVYLPRALAGVEGVANGQWAEKRGLWPETGNALLFADGERQETAAGVLQQSMFCEDGCLRPSLAQEFARNESEPSDGCSCPPSQLASPVSLFLDAPSPFAVGSSFVGSWVFSNLFSLLVVGLGLCGAWMYQIDIPHPLAHNSQKTISQKTIETGDLKFVGRVTGVADVKWSDQQTATVMGANVPLGRQYALASGLLEITYRTGAKVILEGPASYVVESEAGGYLSVGKLTARLEKRAEGRGEREKEVASGQWSGKVASGQWPVASETNPKIPKSQIPNPSTSPAPAFAVRTPTAVVTDLGTEFGVEVHKNGITEAHVFVGRVSMVSTHDGSLRGSPRILMAGEAASTNEASARVAHTSWNEKRFIRIMPLQPAAIGYKVDYASIVLAMNPAVYYRMERPKEEEKRFILLDFAPGGHHGKVHLVNEYAQPWMWGHVGDSLFLHGPVDSEYAVVSDYPKSQSDQLSASAWVLAEGLYPSAKIAGNWGGGKHGQFHFGMYKDDASFYAAVAQRDNGEVFVHEGPAKPFPLNQWQHVAFSLDKSTLRLYRNGIEVAQGHCDGLLQKVQISCLTIGCQSSDDRDSMFNFWRGRIDELAIFNRAISPKEVQRLYRPGAK